MSQKEFVLDIIVNKLELKDDQIKDTKNLLVKFSFDDIQLDITTSRINVADFGEGRSVEFSSTLEDLKRKLRTSPLKLRILNPNVNADSGGDKSEARSNSEALEHAGGGNDEDTNSEKTELKSAFKLGTSTDKTPSNIIGTVSCNWPSALIEKLKDNCTAVIPHIQVCDIKRNADVVGNITLGIMLHCKCEERPSTTDRPYTNDRGILTAFENIHKEIEKNDVFFVIGKKPEERDDPISEFLREVAPCSESNRHPVRLNTSRYKFLRGTLVKDCDVLNNDVCGQQVGCPDWYQPPARSAEIFKNKEKRRSCHCDIAQLELVNKGRLSTKVRKQSGKPDRKVKENVCHPVEMLQEEINPTKMLHQILEDRLKLYEREQEKLGKGRQDATNLRAKDTLPIRYCIKCCQNLTFQAKFAPCPNCGYRPSKKTVFRKDETAEDIAQEWDSDEKCFLENNGFSKYDHCTCHERGDRKNKDRKCLYCRIRKICDEVTDFGPQNESLTSPRKDRILSESDRDADNEDALCDEIIAEYGDDPNEQIPKKKIWKGGAEAPRLSLIMDFMKQQIAPPIEEPLNESIKSRKGKPKKDLEKTTMTVKQRKPSKNEEQGIASLSREERIKKMMASICDPEPEKPPKKTKPKTIKQLMKEMKRKYRHRYCYPKRKPVLKSAFSHDECVPESCRVPANMGWLWNRDEKAMKRGWRPGKIGRSIRELMTYFLTEFPVDTLPTTQETTALKRPSLLPEPEEELVQKPTLHIQKLNGKYFVTMHPLKREQELKRSADPYAKTDPIQFIVTKDPIELKRRQIKRYLKEIGFKKCECNEPISKCTCRSYIEKERLENSLKDICDVLQTSTLKDMFCLSDTTDSESHLNIEFTPPAGIIKPHLKEKPDIAEMCTQYQEKDYIIALPERTEAMIRKEARKKKRHSCSAPIAQGPCQSESKQRKYRKAKHTTSASPGKSSERHLAGQDGRLHGKGRKGKSAKGQTAKGQPTKRQTSAKTKGNKK